MNKFVGLAALMTSLFIGRISKFLLLIPLLVAVAIYYLDSDAISWKEWRNGRIIPLIPPEPYTFEKRRKSNMNVLIVGTSGKGKTNLMDLLLSRHFSRYVVFSFKKGDLHLKLDADIVDVSEYGPFDKESFVEAFMLTFQPRVVGEVVSRYAGLLQILIERSEDWSSLLLNLDEMIKSERDRINKTTLISLREKINLLVPAKNGDIPLKERAVYDFSSLNDYQKCFFAEILLRKLKNSENMAIAIDEAYNVFRRTEHHYSVAEDILRGGRSRNIAFIAATQSILDIPPPLIPQFDTIYVFSTSGEDIGRIARIGFPEKLIRRLDNYECIDIRSDKTWILRFRRFKGKKKNREEEKKEESNKEGSEEAPGDIPYEEMPKVSYEEAPGNISYEEEILSLLSERGIASTSEIARALSLNHKLDPDSMRFVISPSLRRLYERGEIRRTELIDEFGRKTVYYELPSENESEIHKLIVKKVEIIAKKLGISVKKGKDVDLILGEIGVEVETGKKRRKPVKREGYREVITVVPNDKLKDQDAVTLRELYERLRGGTGEKIVKGAVRAYREGKKGINWVIGVIEKSGLRKEDVERLLEDLKAEDILKEWEKRSSA